jgi:hypothetical protein
MTDDVWVQQTHISARGGAHKQPLLNMTQFPEIDRKKLKKSSFKEIYQE